MIEQGALEAIRRGRRGVHLSWRGRVLEACELRPIGNEIFVETRHLNGEQGPTVRAAEATALERTYEKEESC